MKTIAFPSISLKSKHSLKMDKVPPARAQPRPSSAPPPSLVEERLSMIRGCRRKTPRERDPRLIMHGTRAGGVLGLELALGSPEMEIPEIIHDVEVNHRNNTTPQSVRPHTAGACVDHIEKFRLHRSASRNDLLDDTDGEGANGCPVWQVNSRSMGQFGIVGKLHSSSLLYIEPVDTPGDCFSVFCGVFEDMSEDICPDLKTLIDEYLEVVFSPSEERFTPYINAVARSASVS